MKGTRTAAGVAVTAAIGLTLAGCGAPAQLLRTRPLVGYVIGAAYPCGMGIEPAAHIELVVVGPGSSSPFTEPTSSALHRFRFATEPGHYRIYEDQRYAGSYERVGGPIPVEVRAGTTARVTVSSFCK